MTIIIEMFKISYHNDCIPKNKVFDTSFNYTGVHCALECKNIDSFSDTDGIILGSN